MRDDKISFVEEISLCPKKSTHDLFFQKLARSISWSQWSGHTDTKSDTGSTKEKISNQQVERKNEQPGPRPKSGQPILAPQHFKKSENYSKTTSKSYEIRIRDFPSHQESTPQRSPQKSH